MTALQEEDTLHNDVEARDRSEALAMAMQAACRCPPELREVGDGGGREALAWRAGGQMQLLGRRKRIIVSILTLWRQTLTRKGWLTSYGTATSGEPEDVKECGG